ncbi:MAG TPA: RNA pseudouridine synthase, partial [Bacilli bacterium]|nr:RNA pseudouridine synthase [Bacilli bacterium]
EKGIIKSYMYKSKTNEMYSGHKTKTGKFAETHYQVIKKGETYSLVDINILTGRKNQIRVHLKDIDYPIVGDRKYGGDKSPINRLCLHAYELQVKHPLTSKTLNFKSLTPKDFVELVK